jgi:hypothetical protein
MLVDWVYNWDVMTDRWKSIYAFTYCIVIIVSLSVETLSHNEPACSGASHDGDCAQGLV